MTIETIEYCHHCGTRYEPGCVKGLGICTDCREAGHTQHWMLSCPKCDEEQDANQREHR
jgi:phage terminase large subunit GpA-like protein